jgi:CRISPR-associated protein (TIGR02710 family)
MKKLMIMTLGTGRGVENGIARSIETNNPDAITFIVTPQSQEMVPKVAEVLAARCRQQLPPHDTRVLSRESSVDAAYHITQQAIREAQQRHYARHEIYLDFTSGTKAMTVGAALAALLAECEKMVYIGGFERDREGRVVTGSEIVMAFTPNQVFADYKKHLAKQMFNAYQFDAGLKLLRETRRRIERDDVKELEVVFQAYERWDKFDHATARQHFEDPRITSKPVRDRIGPNRGFVNQLAKALAARPEHIIPEQIVDLLANAGRRAEEGKFDDAVARLYRIVELLAQYRLQEGLNLSVKGLKTSDLDLTRLPADLRPRYEALRKAEGAVNIGLAQAFTLLGELGDQEWSDRYWNNQKLRGLLTRRNQSVLAHGLTPVDRAVYAELAQEVRALVYGTVPNLEALAQRAGMIKFE